ncbi:HSP20-like chaperone [Fomitiporia mediterranea MF3/22]|uniref:HSP20-like chaperone n=1 Tax=Fomitiporia mediterranea (strain MF3/22) TaxID=694068 RepID=UPI00044096AD|nr:HSP20-like chaperone [Fomitiporia mediterranea MF3/22]EJC98617.1 HSP20-like chaperone [Fomitiporia mediterranea MF3/22]
MSVYYYEPFFSFNDISRFFDDALSRTSGGQQVARAGDTSERSLARGFQPRVDIHESPENNQVTATFELPGLQKENVSIDVQNGRLVVSGEQTVSKDVEEKGFVHRERQMGRFSRTLPLPTGTKPTDIQAKMENGLLTVTFPKTSQEQQPQRITIA